MSRYRIVFLSGSAGDWGGASRVLFNTLRMLDRRLFEPIVLLPRTGPAIELLDSLEVRHRQWTLLADSAPAWQRYGRAVASSLRVLRETQADILDINPYSWRMPEILAARMLRIPVVRHLHLVVTKADVFDRFASALIAVSKFAADQYPCASSRVEVISNTVVLDRFDRAASIRPELKIGEGDVVITFVGQVTENKGVDSFLRMAHRLPGANLVFLIAGECRDPRIVSGAYDEARLRREIGNDNRIQYLGYRRDIERVFRSSDIVVVPSRWEEPFGLVNVEAGAAGVPVVATRDGGIPEVIRDSENGLLVDVGDEVGLVAAVRRLVESLEMRRRIGRRAREIVEDNFTTAPVRKLERLYLDLLSH